MNKAQLIEKIAEQTQLARRDVEKFMEVWESVIVRQLQQGEEVTITGFGAFIPKFRHARAGVNPRKPSERIQMPAVTVAKFKAGKNLKEALKHNKAEQQAAE